MHTNTQGRLAALATVAALGLAACGDGKDAEAEAAAAPAAVVQQVGAENVAVVRQESIETGPAISGELQAERQAELRAQAGGTVLRVLVEQGQRVSRGQLLAQLDDAAVRDQFLGARSGVTSAQAGATLAGRELERAERLLAGGAVAQRDVEGARQQHVAAQAGLADARARLALAERMVENTRVTAPFAGVVARRDASAGSVVAPGAPLFLVVEPGSMRLEASVPAEQAGEVRAGMPVSFTVSGYGDRAFEGRVTRVSPVADPATRQVPIIATIPNAGSTLVGGLFAEGRVASERREGIVVPQSAVDSRGLAPVATRVRNGKVEKVTLQLGIVDAAGERVEVRAGLAAGDTVLLGAATGISAGAPVKVGAVADGPASAATGTPATAAAPKR